MSSYSDKHKAHRVNSAQSQPTPNQMEKMAPGEGEAPPNAVKSPAGSAYGRQPGHDGNNGAVSSSSINKESTPKKQKTGKIRRILAFSILGLLLIAAGVLIKFYSDISNPAGLFQDEIPTPTPSPFQPDATATPIPTPSPTPDPEAVLLSEADLEFMRNRVNIMMLGLDESTERENWGSFRTDTMILVTIDFETNDVTMISIPRDSYVKICNGEGRPINSKNGEGSMFGKVNSAFPTGGGAQKNGYAYAMGTVSYLLGGIPINYYVGFNMNVVKEIVNAMGGLEYEVDIEVNMNGRKLLPGLQHMDGQAVLDYCRQRKGSSDIERVDRQQRMLTAIFHELKNTGQIVNIPQIYTAVEQNLQTNLSFKQISSLALLAMKMDLSQLSRRTVDGSFLNMRSISYWGLYTNKVSAMVQEVFGISVNIDSDVNVTNIRAQIEANRQLIAVELNEAKNAIDTANALLQTYGGYLTDDIKAALKAAKSQCENAYTEEDKDLLDYYTPPLVQLNNSIWASLQGHGLINPQPQDYVVPEMQ